MDNSGDGACQAEGGGLQNLVVSEDLKQLTDTGCPERWQLPWLQKKNCGCVRNLERPWRRTFSQPRESSGKWFGDSGKKTESYAP